MKACPCPKPSTAITNTSRLDVTKHLLFEQGAGVTFSCRVVNGITDSITKPQNPGRYGPPSAYTGPGRGEQPKPASRRRTYKHRLSNHNMGRGYTSCMKSFSLFNPVHKEYVLCHTGMPKWRRLSTSGHFYCHPIDDRP